MAEGEVTNRTEGAGSNPPRIPDRAIPAASPKRRTITAPVTGKRATGVPAQPDAPEGEQSSLGERLAIWRKRRGYSLEDVGSQVGKTREWVRLVEADRVQELPTKVIAELKQAVGELDPTGWEGMRLREALEELEARRRTPEALYLTDVDMQWLRTLNREGMTLGNSIRYLRLSTGLSQVGFVERAKEKGITIDPYVLDDYENDNNIPFPSNLTDVMRAAGLDTDTKSAQFLRLHAEKYNLYLPTKGDLVMSLDDLQRCTFGTLMRYLRIQKGVTFTQLGIDLGYSPTSSFISGVERDEKTYPISEKSVENFITWLDLPPRSALADIIRRKHKNGPEKIPEDIAEEVLKERYLFAEHFAFPQYVLSKQDSTLLAGLKQRSSLRGKVDLLKDEGNEDEETRSGFWKSRKVYTNFLRSLNQEGHSVYEVNIVRLLMVYGYDIHHPITWHFLGHLRPLKSA